MNVLVINQSDIKGGAALVPWRMWEHIAKNDSSIHVNFLVARKFSHDKNVVQILPKFLFYVEKVINKITDLVGLQYFIQPFSTVSILWNVRKFNPDVIHLNNLHGGYFWLPLLIFLGKKYPIVWTMHDVWPVHRNSAFFTGHENWKHMQAFPGEKNFYPKIGLDTGSLLLKYKNFIYKHANFTVVTPSMWMKNEILAPSPLMKGKTITQIYNGLDVDTYVTHASKAELRKQYAIPQNDDVIIFIAAYLDVPLKGMRELIDTLTIIDQKATKPLHLICIGGSTPEMFPPFKNVTLHQLGYISDPLVIRNYFSLSDLFLYTSKAESLGMVLVESIASGTPAIVFNVGGCPEVIENDRNGYVIPQFNIKMFAEKALSLLANKTKQQTFQKAGEQLAKERFDIKDMAAQHMDLIRKLIAQK